MLDKATPPYSELASQYTTKVAADLEHNVQEQARVSDQIKALEEQLAGLQRDHTVLVKMREALGSTLQVPAPAAPATTAVPAPRKDAAHSGAAGPASARPTASRSATSGSGKAKQSQRKKPAAVTSPANTNTKSQAQAGSQTQRKAKAKTATQTVPAATPGKEKADKQPTLVDLVREHLTRTNEPLSAAEITTALGETHPQRSIKTTVVRNTLENLVAKGRAERSRQGSAVFYTAAGKTQEAPSEQSPKMSSAVQGKDSEAPAAAAQTG
jgi:predicted transcriptional regulator